MTIGQDATRLAAQLFPRWSKDLAGNPELAKCWADQIDRFSRLGLSRDQIEAVVRQHRAERSGVYPDLKTIVGRLAEIHRGQTVTKDTAARAQPVGHQSALLRHLMVTRGGGDPIRLLKSYYSTIYAKYATGASGHVPAYLRRDAAQELEGAGMSESEAERWAEMAEREAIALVPRERDESTGEQETWNG